MSAGAIHVRPNSCRRRRRAIGAVLCLLGGVVMTVAAAGACLMYAPMKTVVSAGGISGGDADGRPLGYVGFKPGQVYRGVGVRETMDYWYWVTTQPTGERTVAGAGVRSNECGWPLLAFATARDEFPSPCRDMQQWNAAVQAAYADLSTNDVVPGFLRARPYRGIPARVLPAGLAINTALYGGLLAAVAYGVPWARRARRRRGGRCEGCGYPAGGLGRCPECGGELPGAHWADVWQGGGLTPLRGSHLEAVPLGGLTPPAAGGRRFAAEPVGDGRTVPLDELADRRLPLPFPEPAP